jgi:hypothetical protein
MKKFIYKSVSGIFNLLKFKTNNNLIKILSILLWVQILIWVLKFILLFIK